MKSLPTRIFLIAALLFTGLLTVAPKVIGLGIEQATIDSVLELIPPEAGSQFEIRRNEFSEGWFRSAATIEVIYRPIGTDAVALSMDFDIDHGPLLQTQDGLKIGLAYANITPSIRNDLFEIAVAEFEFPLPQISLNLLARFDQSLRIAMDVKAVEYSGTQGYVNFAGIEASVDVNRDQSARFALEMGELSASEVAANSDILVAGLSLVSTTAQMNDILAASSAALSVPVISSTSPVPFSVSGFSINYGLQDSPNHPQSSEIHQTLKVTNIEGELPIRSFYWQSEIKQLSDELMRDYYRLVSKLQSEMNSDPDTVSDELGVLGQEMLLLTLQNPLEFNNLIRFNAYEGDHSADLRMQWAGLSTLGNVAELDTSAAIAALNITLLISFDLEAVLSSPLAGLVDPYVQQGYLTVSNGRVIVEASLQDSVLKMNGDEVALDQFF
ncbi:MAG: DUF945 family protein [Pseudohongiellaceae bacterium]